MIFNITPGSPRVTLSGGYCTLSKTLVREVKWGEDISWGSTCIKRLLQLDTVRFGRLRGILKASEMVKI